MRAPSETVLSHGHSKFWLKPLAKVNSFHETDQTVNQT